MNPGRALLRWQLIAIPVLPLWLLIGYGIFGGGAGGFFLLFLGSAVLFVFQAVMRAGGRYGTTAAELGRALGVSKQAAGKTIDTLQGLGYLRPGQDPDDARRKNYTLTPYAYDALQRSERIFDDLRDQWAGAIGEDRLRDMVEDLRKVTPSDAFHLDTPQWFNAP